MQETWKDIKGYEGLYQVSNIGNIKNIKRNKLLKLNTHKQGYNVVNLCKCGKVKKYLVHRLVAEAFIPNTENKPQVNHIDGNKKNNNIDNLEFVTNSENTIHAYRTGLKCNAKRVKQLDLQGRFIKEWESMLQASRELKISYGIINECVSGKRKTARGYIWK